jgi:NADPH-dependent 2,4-dienoyl-CoA reductase/sulfur reductase-like enzyme
MTDDLVIVGASLAGVRGAEAARRMGYRGPLTLIGAEPHHPYDRPPLSKSYLADAEPQATPLGQADLSDSLGVELCLGRKAVGLDTCAHELHLVTEPALNADVVGEGTEPSAEGIKGRICGEHAGDRIDQALDVRT